MSKVAGSCGRMESFVLHSLCLSVGVVKPSRHMFLLCWMALGPAKPARNFAFWLWNMKQFASVASHKGEVGRPRPGTAGPCPLPCCLVSTGFSLKYARWDCAALLSRELAPQPDDPLLREELPVLAAPPGRGRTQTENRQDGACFLEERGGVLWEQSYFLFCFDKPNLFLSCAKRCSVSLWP